MKHFVTLVACFASFIAVAQNPNYDPDSNGDDLIGAADLTSLLAVYNTSLAVDTTLECNFNGTAEEEWLFGILTGEVILDSMVVQFSISDSALYYEPGCPIPQYHTLQLELEYVLDNVSSTPTELKVYGNYPNQWVLKNKLTFDLRAALILGEHYWTWIDWNLRELRDFTAPFGADYNFEYSSNAAFACSTIESDYAQTFSLDEDGLASGIRCNGLPDNSGPFGNPVGYNYFRILPYWHYAE